MGGIKFGDAGNGGGVVGANNGLSLDTLNKVVLGQNVGAVGNPGILNNDRVIPLGAFTLQILADILISSYFNFGLDTQGIGVNAFEIKGNSAGGDGPSLILSDPVGSPINKYFWFAIDSDEFSINTDAGFVLSIDSTKIFTQKQLQVGNRLSGSRFVVDLAASGSTGSLEDGRKVFTNRGAAGAITITIPSTIGCSYLFYNVTGNVLNIQAQAGTTIRNGVLLKAAPGILTNNAIGSCIEIVMITNNECVVTQVIGAWV